MCRGVLTNTKETIQGHNKHPDSQQQFLDYKNPVSCGVGTRTAQRSRNAEMYSVEINYENF